MGTTETVRDFWGIVVAAGSGSRFGSPKHSLELAGRPFWQWGRDVLLAGGAGDVVVVGDVPGGLAGGARRRDSVGIGLAAVPGRVRFVLVHDAARPLAGAALVERVIARLRRGDVDGVVPAVPVRDTVKRTDGDRVIATVDRAGLLAIQTPQGFRRDALVAAHNALAGDTTDDAALVERTGGVVVTVPGDPTNVKVTYPGDLTVVRALLESRLEKP